MTGEFDAVHVADFFDAYGEAEWDRHERTAAARVSFAVHCRLLQQHIRPGDLVLDAGAGPGRFAIEAARLGASVHVGDISPRQVELSRDHILQAGVEASVVAYDVIDICDLSPLATGTFDVVVCFGGPLSYVRNRADTALAELVRVTKPGGSILISVMSVLGAMRAFLSGVVDEDRRYGPDHGDRILATGDLERDTNAGHEMHMYRWTELAALCRRHATIESASAANYLSAGLPNALVEGLSASEWDRLLARELGVVAEPGVLDAGTHIVVALRTAP